MRRSILAFAAACLVGTLLSACSLAPGGAQIEKAAVTVIDSATTERKAYNDQKADVLLTLPCDISIGAYYRIENSVKQEALTMLCSGKRPGEPAPSLVTNSGLGLVTIDPFGLPEPASP